MISFLYFLLKQTFDVDFNLRVLHCWYLAVQLFNLSLLVRFMMFNIPQLLCDCFILSNLDILDYCYLIERRHGARGNKFDS